MERHPQGASDRLPLPRCGRWVVDWCAAPTVRSSVPPKLQLGTFSDPGKGLIVSVQAGREGVRVPDAIP
jgi:hypothetical protein